MKKKILLIMIVMSISCLSASEVGGDGIKESPFAQSCRIYLESKQLLEDRLGALKIERGELALRLESEGGDGELYEKSVQDAMSLERFIGSYVALDPVKDQEYLDDCLEKLLCKACGAGLRMTTEHFIFSLKRARYLRKHKLQEKGEQQEALEKRTHFVIVNMHGLIGRLKDISKDQQYFSGHRFSCGALSRMMETLLEGYDCQEIE